MAETVICNPPINLVNNQKTHIGHLFYTTLLDVSYRYKKDLMGQSIYFPGRSYNLYGKPSERYIKDRNISMPEFESDVESILQKDLDIRDINISNMDLIVDDSEEVERFMCSLLSTLNENGYVRISGSSLYLMLDQIDEEGFFQEFNSVAIYPSRVRNKLIRLFKDRRNELLITRDREYAPRCDLVQDRVAPFLVVSLFWGGYYPKSSFVLPSSFNLVLRSVLLRMLVDYLAYGRILVKEVFIYPKVIGEDLRDWNIERLSLCSTHKDMLRFTLCSSYSSKSEMVEASLDNLKFAVTFFKRLIRIGKKCKKLEYLSEGLQDEDYKLMIESYEYRKVVHHIWNKMLSIEPDTCSSADACEVLRMAYPVVPYTCSVISKGSVALHKELEVDVGNFITNIYSK